MTRCSAPWWHLSSGLLDHQLHLPSHHIPWFCSDTYLQIPSWNWNGEPALFWLVGSIFLRNIRHTRQAVRHPQHAAMQTEHQRKETRVGVKRNETGQRDPLLQVASKTKTGHGYGPRKRTQACDWQGKAWQAIFPPLCSLKYGFVPSLHHFMGPSSQLWGWTWRTKKCQSVFHSISMIIWSLKNHGFRGSMWVFKGRKMMNESVSLKQQAFSTRSNRDVEIHFSDDPDETQNTVDPLVELQKLSNSK